MRDARDVKALSSQARGLLPYGMLRDRSARSNRLLKRLQQSTNNSDKFA